MLRELIDKKLIDYIAMDIKAPLAKYENTVNVLVACDNLVKSVKIIIESGLPHEFRTTVVPGLLEKEDFQAMGELIKGADNWYLQKFKSDTDLVDNTFEGKSAYTDKEMTEFAEIGRQAAGVCEVRS
jgi:pyruvate formate lyase activating enzyme